MWKLLQSTQIANKIMKLGALTWIMDLWNTTIEFAFWTITIEFCTE